MPTGDAHADYWTTDPATRLGWATGVSVDPRDPAGVELVRGFLACFPEWCRRAEEGADHLELGCGVAGGVLAQLQLFPRLRSTAVEIAPDLVEVAARRARDLGLTDRLELVTADAATFDRPASADLSFWSQFFFPAPSRAATLDAAHRALRPGGLLLAPLVGEPGPDDDDLASFRATLTSWGVPLRTPSELVAELDAAGFTDAHVVRAPRGDAVLARRT